MNYLVIGMQKSGTTVTYQAIVNATNDTNSIYIIEPNKKQLSQALACIKSRKYENYVLKILTSSINVKNFDFSIFDKIVLTVRDIRDNLISRFLHRPTQSNYYQNREFMNDLVELLCKKSDFPKEISLAQIRSLYDKYGNPTFRNSQLRKDLVDSHYLSDNVDLFCIKYEDFLEGNTSNLSSYLSLDISSNVTLDNVHISNTRQKAHSYWKEWFTEEDCLYYQPIFNDFLIFFNYDTKWSLSEKPKISREYSSDYIVRTIENRLTEINFLQEIAQENQSQGEAIKFGELKKKSNYTQKYLEILSDRAKHSIDTGAILELARAYHVGWGVAPDEAKCLKLLNKAAHLGNQEAQNELQGLLTIKN